MKLFRRKKITDPMSGAWVRFRSVLDDRHHKAADYLQRQTLRFSRFQLYIFFTLFCLLTGSVFVYMVISAFESGNTVFPITPISVPHHIIEHPNERGKREGNVQLNQYAQVLQILRQMDSLKVNDRLYYDSIIQLRPGLLDSIDLLEDFYKAVPGEYRRK